MAYQSLKNSSFANSPNSYTLSLRLLNNPPRQCNSILVHHRSLKVANVAPFAISSTHSASRCPSHVGQICTSSPLFVFVFVSLNFHQGWCMFFCIGFLFYFFCVCENMGQGRGSIWDKVRRNKEKVNLGRERDKGKYKSVDKLQMEHIGMQKKKIVNPKFCYILQGIVFLLFYFPCPYFATKTQFFSIVYNIIVFLLF